MSDSDEEMIGSKVVGNKRKAPVYGDSLVDQALKAADEEKRARKVSKKVAEGKTLAEIEEEEGGPIKESKIGMAQTQRAMGRKSEPAKDEAGSVAVDGTDVDKFEEKAQVEEEDGVKFTGFNLNEERETGHFDDQGNYVEAKEKGEKDAWMNSDEAKVVSAEVRQKLEARRVEEERLANQKRAPLTDRQIAELKNELASHMLPGEVLARALKRISGSNAQQTKAMGKRERQRLQQQQQQEHAASTQSKKPKWQQQGAADASAGTTPNSEVFLRMTEIADLLVLEGEVDVYDGTREDYERFASMWLPKKGPAQAAGPSSAAPAKATADDDDDMFGNDEEFENKGAAPTAVVPTDAETGRGGEPSAPTTTAPAPAASAEARGAAGPASTSEPEVDYSTWPIKELKRCLQERGVDASTFTEKAELVAKVREVLASQPVAAGNTTFDVPYGYVFDPTSGLFYNEQAGMFFDHTSGYYAAGGKWYTVNEAGEFVEYSGA